MNRAYISVLGVIMVSLMGLSDMPASADFGFANSQCSRWMDPEKAVQEMARRQWVFGYLTATVRYGNKDILNSDPNKLIESLRAHCQSHPGDSLETATEALVAGME